MAARTTPTAAMVMPLNQKKRFLVSRVIEQMTKPISRKTSPPSKRSARWLTISRSSFKILGLIADGVFVFFVALDFLDVFFVDGGGFFFVAGREDREHVGDCFHFVEADVFGLVVGPLVAGFGLEEEFFGVGAMA